MGSTGKPVLNPFGSFFLLDKIAEGGMAELFRARPADPEANGRVIVIKRILPHIAGDNGFIQMFKTEIRVCMGFNHPNTVQIYDFGEVNGVPYIAMEYVEGVTVAELIQRVQEIGRPLPITTALGIVVLACAGLEYVHNYTNQATGKNPQVIHRDISPQNILVSYGGHVKLIDFGIAKAQAETQENTVAGFLKGKVSYFSPEQAAGRPLDARTDIFSLGIVLWELLAGRRLFFRSDQNTLNVLEAIRNPLETIVPPSTHNPAVPPQLDAIVLRALERDPEQRIQTAAEFKGQLSTVLRFLEKSSLDQHLSQFMGTLFGKEIEEGRAWLRNLNQMAQSRLSAAKTRISVVDLSSFRGRTWTEVRFRSRKQIWGGALVSLLFGASAFAVASDGAILKRISRGIESIVASLKMKAGPERPKEAQPGALRFALTDPPARVKPKATPERKPAAAAQPGRRKKDQLRERRAERRVMRLERRHERRDRKHR